MNREIRSGIPVQDVGENADGSLKVEGYAAVFGQETDIGGMFREVIERGAFKEAIGRDDVVFLINHKGLPLARTRSGTLRLSEDDHGLKIQANLDPEDPDVRSIAGKIKRGDLDKMSFAFLADRDGGEDWGYRGDTPLRTIKKASLFDVSVVTNEAYSGTEIALRSLEAARSERVETAQEFRLRMKRKLIR